MKTARDTKRAAARRTRRCRASRSPATPTPGSPSLLNRLTGAGVLVENALFATLDPTVRRCQTADGRDVHAGRHGRLRAAPAAPARRGVPLHAGGGRRRRPDPARRRRPPTPTRRRRSRAVREVLAEIDALGGARDRRDQQGRRRRPEMLVRLRRLAPGRRLRLRDDGPRPAELTRRHRAAAAAPRHRGQRAAAVHPRRPGRANPRIRGGALDRTLWRGHAAPRPGRTGAGRRSGAVRSGRWRTLVGVRSRPVAGP